VLASDIDSAAKGAVRPRAADSVLTQASMGLVAYISCDLLHEFAGHGSVCVVTGGRVASFSAFHFQCFGGWQALVSAAGILVNLVVGVCLLAWLAGEHGFSTSMRYFLTLAMAYNLFSGCGYILGSAFTNSGDWANVARLFAISSSLRAGILFLAAVVYGFSVVGVAKHLGRIYGSNIGRMWPLVFVPYFSAALAALFAAAVNAIMAGGQAWMSAIGTTLGNWGFLFLPLIAAIRRKRIKTAEGGPLPYSTTWIVTALGFLAAFLVAASNFRLS
jgi:hypothetical protein